MAEKIFNEKTRRYEVGFGKPPRESRWKKGQSGNPRGRPPFVYEEDEAPLRRYLLEPYAVTIKGKKVKMPAVDLIAKHLVAKAAQGCLPSIKILLKESRGFAALHKEFKRQMTEADREMIDKIAHAANTWTSRSDSTSSRPPRLVDDHDDEPLPEIGERK